MEKHYSEVSSTWRNFEQICSELGLREEDIIGKFILDLGSGGAGFSEGIKKHPEFSSRVVSMDPNYNPRTLTEENKELMKDAVKEIGAQKLEAVAGLSEKIPFADATFDLIISNHAIPWHIAEDVGKVQKSVEEIVRILKSGGEVRLHPVEENITRVIADAVGGDYSVENKKGVVIIRKVLSTNGEAVKA